MVGRSLLLLVAVIILGACRPAERIRSAVDAGGDPQALVERIPLPYTQIRVQINGGTPGRLFLAQTKAGVGQWVGSDGLRLWTREGRIIATEGFRGDLINMHRLDAPGGESLHSADAGPESRSYYVQLEAPMDDVIVEVWPGQLHPATPVSFGGRVELLARYTESVHVPSTGARWTNEYWFVPETGHVVITRQRLPGVPYDIRIEQLP
ncbi:YjbF family lipoprotein [Algiphilus sp.]|uniref:YjbF family lipoprotein n=1 Tax=Algiphilus sp. TaxID=1872431 RepID=UPI003B52233F